MLRIVLVLVVALILMGAVREETEVGQYQLFQGRFLIGDAVKQGEVYAEAVFRINTKTGKVWRLHHAQGTSAFDGHFWKAAKEEVEVAEAMKEKYPGLRDK